MFGNGVYAAVKTGDCVRTVHIEEEVLELERINDATGRHRMVSEDQRRKKTRKASSRKAEGQRLLVQEVVVLAISILLYICLCTGLISRYLGIPLTVICLAVVSFRAGKWFGKYPIYPQRKRR